MMWGNILKVFKEISLNISHLSLSIGKEKIKELFFFKFMIQLQKEINEDVLL